MFAGVGQTDEEITAGLKAGVLMFSVESEAELDAIDRVAKSVGKSSPDRPARVNPDIDPKTHRYHLDRQEGGRSSGWTSTTRSNWASAIKQQPERVDDRRPHAHRVMQIATVRPLRRRRGEKAVAIIGQFRGDGAAPIAWFNMGGGFGIAYRGGEAKGRRRVRRGWSCPTIKATGCRLAMEPGRVIAGNAPASS